MEKNYLTDKGLLVFYDWEECFDSLSGDEFKELFLAMLRFKKYGTTPPEFTGVSKIIASLLFPQLERQIQEFQNGKKGGRPKKNISDDNGNSKHINNEGKNPIKQERDDLMRAAIEKKRQIDNSRSNRDWAVAPEW